MTKQLEAAFQQLADAISPSSLAGTTSRIINAYRNKQYHVIRTYARRIYPDADQQPLNRLFSILVQTFHPDKHAVILKEAQAVLAQKDLSGLYRLHGIYLESHPEISDIIYIHDEDYGYSEEEFDHFGIQVMSADEFFSQEDENHDIQTPGINFGQAIKGRFRSGEELDYSSIDLEQTAGELDLQDMYINDISGIENYTNISQLNLSHNLLQDVRLLSQLSRLETLYLSENKIVDITPLANLYELSELDLAFNHISVIDALAMLPKLRYLNILGNPLADSPALDLLRHRGVVCIV